MKPVSPAATYVSMVPVLTEAAREVGYALAVHGSMGRDLDLVAIPWTAEAVSAEALIMRLLSVTGFTGGGRLRNRTSPPDGQTQDPTQSNGDIGAVKPHGRRAWSIHFDNGLYLDVSVMPRTAPRALKPTEPAK